MAGNGNANVGLDVYVVSEAGLCDDWVVGERAWLGVGGVEVGFETIGGGDN
jgi:hypothetical protein